MANHLQLNGVSNGERPNAAHQGEVGALVSRPSNLFLCSPELGILWGHQSLPFMTQLRNPTLFTSEAFIDGKWIKKNKEFAVYGI